MKIELVRWDLEAGRMGVHRPQTGLLIDGVFYELPHRNQLSARDDLRAALELAGVDFDKGHPDALERQIDAARRRLHLHRCRFNVSYKGQKLCAHQQRLAKLLEDDITRTEARIAHLESLKQ